MSSSGNNPKEWKEIEEIKKARPKSGFVEVSLQRLTVRGTTILVQWMGAKNGRWYPHGDIFIITKSKLL